MELKRKKEVSESETNRERAEANGRQHKCSRNSLRSLTFQFAASKSAANCVVKTRTSNSSKS
eukprot:6192773-Pleurochrysis_carterae.AAC.2